MTEHTPSEIEQFHQLAEFAEKLGTPVEMSADSIICLDREIRRLLATNAQNYGASRANADLAINIAKDFDAVSQERDRLRTALETAPTHHTHNCYTELDEYGQPILGECHPLCWERKRQAALREDK